MWIRAELKKRAWTGLKEYYWMAFLISLVMYITQGSITWTKDSNPMMDHYPMLYPHVIIPIVGLAVIIGILIYLFLRCPIEVGGRKFFIRSAEKADNQKCFKFAYDRNNLKGIILTLLLRDVQNVLWFLLLIVPGIIKAYAYRMVPYILADNPNIGCKKAIALSIKMTNGQKWKIFVLDLSFVGWFLLGLLAVGIGVIFVLPYYNATCAELYLVLRKNALENNFCTYDDLLLDNPDQLEPPDNPEYII